MHWRKRDVWKIGALVGILLFFVSITWNSGSAVYAHSLVSAQATPAEDATVTAFLGFPLIPSMKRYTRA